MLVRHDKYSSCGFDLLEVVLDSSFQLRISTHGRRRCECHQASGTDEHVSVEFFSAPYLPRSQARSDPLMPPGRHPAAASHLPQPGQRVATGIDSELSGQPQARSSSVCSI